MLPLKHKRLWLVLSVLLVAHVVYGSLAPDPPIEAPGNYDKLEHFSVYLLLAVWFTAFFPRGRYWVVVVGLLVLGLAMELLQRWMDLGRIGDPLDMTANAAGIASGVAMALAGMGGWARKVEAWLSRN